MTATFAKRIDELRRALAAEKDKTAELTRENRSLLESLELWRQEASKLRVKITALERERKQP